MCCYKGNVLHKKDYDLLKDESELNDNLMNFYLRYISPGAPVIAR